MTDQDMLKLLVSLERRFEVPVVPFSTLNYRIVALEFACGEPMRKELGFENRLKILKEISPDTIELVRLVNQMEEVAGVTSEFGQTLDDRIKTLERITKSTVQNISPRARVNNLIKYFENGVKAMNVSEKEDNYLDKFEKLLEQQEVIPPDMENLLEILPYILKLQAQKSAVYGRSYARHGDLSIFLNTERKWDRIANIMEKAMKEGTESLYNEGTPTETFVDTVVDLASYSLLWLGYIKETHPKFFQRFIESNKLEIR